jgi:hypothetical protein
MKEREAVKVISQTREEKPPPHEVSVLTAREGILSLMVFYTIPEPIPGK